MLRIDSADGAIRIVTLLGTLIDWPGEISVEMVSSVAVAPLVSVVSTAVIRMPDSLALGEIQVATVLLANPTNSSPKLADYLHGLSDRTDEQVSAELRAKDSNEVRVQPSFNADIGGHHELAEEA